MSKHKMLKTLSLIMVGFMPAVLASMPRSHEIVDDSAIYQNLRDIKITHEKLVDFDSGIQRLDLDVQKLSAPKKKNLKIKTLPPPVSTPLNRILHSSYKVK